VVVTNYAKMLLFGMRGISFSGDVLPAKGADYCCRQIDFFEPKSIFQCAKKLKLRDLCDSSFSEIDKKTATDRNCKPRPNQQNFPMKPPDFCGKNRCDDMTQ